MHQLRAEHDLKSVFGNGRQGYDNADDPWSEHRIIWEAATNGVSFDDSYHVYFPKLFRAAYRIVRDNGIAEEIAQESMWKAFRGIRTFDTRSSFYTWLVSICRHEAIDSYRDSRRKSLYMTADAALGEDALAYDPGLGEGYDRQKELARGKKVLSKMPREFRIPFIMAYMGYSLQEISHHLGTPMGTVKSRLHRARYEVIPKIIQEGSYGTETHAGRKPFKPFKMAQKTPAEKLFGRKVLPHNSIDTNDEIDGQVSNPMGEVPVAPVKLPRPQISRPDLDDAYDNFVRSRRGMRHDGICYVSSRHVEKGFREELERNRVLVKVGKVEDARRIGIPVIAFGNSRAIFYELDPENFKAYLERALAIRERCDEVIEMVRLS